MRKFFEVVLCIIGTTLAFIIAQLLLVGGTEIAPNLVIGFVSGGLLAGVLHLTRNYNPILVGAVAGALTALLIIFFMYTGGAHSVDGLRALSAMVAFACIGAMGGFGARLAR
jgi:hypothetical protein